MIADVLYLVAYIILLIIGLIIDSNSFKYNKKDKIKGRNIIIKLNEESK